jgi:hypothetical protein
VFGCVGLRSVGFMAPIWRGDGEDNGAPSVAQRGPSRYGRAVKRVQIISTKLHAAWLYRLLDQWREINAKELKGSLCPPVLKIDDASSRLGSWSRDSRTLSIAEHHIWDHAWEEVLATLRHEMAHQYVDEVLSADPSPHGPNFRYACSLLGVTAEASGRPVAGDSESDRVLRKVRKLLALAESDNRHEAEAAMAAANMLLLRYNLAIPKDAPRRTYGHKHLGSSAAALPLRFKLVAGILAEFFFVECIWTLTYNARRDRTERRLEVLGTDANLAMAEHAHDFLHAELDRLWRRHRSRIAAGRGPKREYAAGVLMGFAERLRSERAACAERGLVWVGDADLDEHVQERHPRLRQLTGTGVHATGAHQAGRDAGRSLKIRPPVEGASNLGRRLPRA